MLFLCRNLPVHLQDLLVAKQFLMLDIGRCQDETQISVENGRDLAHAEWLGVSQSVDAECCKRILSQKGLDWLIVDHYALDSVWEKQLRSCATSIMVIDDLADREHDCDILLDQNYYPSMNDRYAGKVPKCCEVLLGPKYSLLREEFRVLRAMTNVRIFGVRKVLIFFGGVDATNYTGQFIRALTQVSMQQLSFDVVVGAQHPKLAEIQAMCADRGLALHVQSKHMAELMMGSDLAIGASGATSWERCCLGLPAITVSLAENQTEIALGLHKMGATVHLGESAFVEAESVVAKLSCLVDRPDDVRSLSERAFALVDGDGVIRVCDALAR